MSSSIAPADLSAATVNATGAMDWSGFGLPAVGGKPARILLYNESGCGLRCNLRGSGRSFEMPAGAWFREPLALQPNEIGLDFTIEDIIPNQLVAKLKGTYIGPGEQFVGVSLGNSPIGISGNVSTTTGQSIKNDGNAPATSIVEATPSDQGSSSVSINNDASGFLQVLSAGILRKILNVVRGNATSGAASIQLGDSGDTSITTFYGTVGAGSIVPGATVSGAVASATNATNATSATNATNASNVPAAGVSAGTLGAGVHETQLNSDGGALVSDGAGNLTMVAGVWGAHGAQLRDDQGGSLELGAGNGVNPGAAQLPYIDFHSSANARDYDVRLMVSGGGAADGLGTLALTAASFTWNGGLVRRGGSAGGGGAGITNWEGTTDPGASAAEGDTWDKG